MGLFSRKNKNGFIDIKIEKLIEWNQPNGEGCFVSNKITKDGFKVGYMYRDEPNPNMPDSGWKFMAGNEDDNYMHDTSNFNILSINTICNYDKDIIPYIYSNIGSKYIRINDSNFEIDDGSKPIFVTKQKN